MDTITREDVQQALETRSTIKIIDVLDERMYDKYHLPGAINVPVDNDFDRKIQSVARDKSEPVIVYCLDSDCEASAKAARLMESLGYEEVYDYQAGKADWKEAGLPVNS